MKLANRAFSWALALSALRPLSALCSLRTLSPLRPLGLALVALARLRAPVTIPATFTRNWGCQCQGRNPGNQEKLASHVYLLAKTKNTEYQRINLGDEPVFPMNLGVRRLG